MSCSEAWNGVWCLGECNIFPTKNQRIWSPHGRFNFKTWTQFLVYRYRNHIFYLVFWSKVWKNVQQTLAINFINISWSALPPPEVLEALPKSEIPFWDFWVKHSSSCIIAIHNVWTKKFNKSATNSDCRGCCRLLCCFRSWNRNRIFCDQKTVRIERTGCWATRQESWPPKTPWGNNDLS